MAAAEEGGGGLGLSRTWTRREPADATDALRELWPDAFPSASSARKALRKRRAPIFINGERVAGKKQVVNFGDVVACEVRGPLVAPSHGGVTRETILAATGPLVLAYLDPTVAVVVKPHGATVTGARSENSLYQKLLFCLPPTEAANPLRRPSPCHRIDGPTYGLVVVARTRGPGRTIGAAFERREVRKRYRAIVHGRLDGGGDGDRPRPSSSGPASGHIRTELSGKETHSEWRAVGRSWEVGAGGGVDGDSGEGTPGGGEKEKGVVRLTCVDLFPHTGRTHQLRRHLKSIGHSIVGDAEHGHESSDRRLLRALAAEDNGDGDGSAPSSLPLMLAAVDIQFPHRASGECRDGSDGGGDGCVMDASSTVSFDEETLRVAIDMPPAMKRLMPS